MHALKKRFCRAHKVNVLITYIMSLDHCTKHLTYKYIFENKLFPATAVQLRQHVEAVGCRASFSGLMSTFVFDILRIPSWIIEICGGCIERTFTPLATCLTTQKKLIFYL